jgi:hypothetical protein
LIRFEMVAVCVVALTEDDSSTVVPISAWAMYPVIGAPPSFVAATAVHERVIVLFVEVGVPMSAGAARGADAGTTVTDGADAALVPRPFVALTVNLYGVPLVSPLTVQTSVLVVGEQVLPVGVLVTTYLMIAVPLAGGADQLTFTAAFSEVTLIPVGAPGTVEGMAEFDAVDVGPVPFTLAALTLNV